jgi:integrase
MAGTVKHKRLESPTARSRLKRGRQPHWQALVEGKVHLGWQCWKGDEQGRWLLRSYVGNRRYRVEGLGHADDGTAEADGVRVLSFAQAYAKAAAMVALPQSKKQHLTVRDVWNDYIEAKRNEGKPIADAISAGNTHILPHLGDLVVAKLDVKRLLAWRNAVAHSRPQLRSLKGQPKYRAAPSTDEEKRARRVSANRVLAYLRAALNRAYKVGDVTDRSAWDMKLEPFKKVDASRERYLTVEEAQRLINVCTPDFRPLVQAALETGCRYGELVHLRVHDFNPDSGTVHVQKSKSGKPRHVTLTSQGTDFFRRQCLGRGGNEYIFVHRDGTPWGKSDQGEPMRTACTIAKITPRISFHILRHTWASLAVMNAMPLMVVAKNLGHRDTRMVEQHYGHLAEDYITKAIREHAPVFAATGTDANVLPLQRTRGVS